MQSKDQFSRRTFCGRLALAFSLVDLAGATWQGVWAGKAGAAESLTGTLQLGVSGYAELESVGGSLLLGVAGMPVDFAPLYITRTAAGIFVSASSRCTHNGCPVSPALVPGFLYCSCHGSRFQMDGTLVNGPATVSLPGYVTRFDGQDTLSIQIPGLGYQITGALISTSAGSRYRLVFPTLAGLSYSVSFRAALNSPASFVNFALTESGPASRSNVTGSGATQTVYLPAPAGQGFYSVIRV